MTRIIALALFLLVPAAPLAAPRLDVEIVMLDAQPTIECTVRARPDALAAAIAQAVMSLLASAGTHRLDIVGPPFARYTTRSKSAIVAEVGLPVRKPPAKRQLTMDVRARELPAGRAALLAFRGRHDHLPGAHAALDAWMAAHKHKPAGPRWEVYLTNPFDTPDPDAQHTRIIAPLLTAKP